MARPCHRKQHGGTSRTEFMVRQKFLEGGTYGPWKYMCFRTEVKKKFVLNLRDGGQLCIFPDLLTNNQQKKIRSELLQCGYFRQYKVQNQDEPRAHFLLHAQATPEPSDYNGEKDGSQYLEDPELPQPGYRYGVVSMKARPLKQLPKLQGLAKRLQNLVSTDNQNQTADTTTFWNIGVNPVLYRDGRDHMGFHADNDQGESLIFSVLVASPNHTTRKVRVQSNDKKEVLELYLDKGDGYSMDGHMQKNYLHGVPSDNHCQASSLGNTNSSNSNEQCNTRIAVVFRRGTHLEQTKDSGRPFASLTPRLKVPYHFGRMDPSVLTEGLTYSRTQLIERNAHRLQQKGVSGNRQVGCDAIIVSGARQDGMGWDGLFHLVYAAGFREGAWSLLSSAATQTPIRVFRSSSYATSVFRAAHPAKQTRYRYDGLYRVEAVFYRTGSISDTSKTKDENSIYRVVNVQNHVTQCKQNASDRIYLFCLERSANDENCRAFSNLLSNKDLLDEAIQAQTLSDEARVAILGLPPQPQERQQKKQQQQQEQQEQEQEQQEQEQEQEQEQQYVLKNWQNYVLFKDSDPETCCGVCRIPEKLRTPHAKIPLLRPGCRRTRNSPPPLSQEEEMAVQQLQSLRADLEGATILQNLSEKHLFMSVYQATNLPETFSTHCPRSPPRRGMKYLETIERTRVGCAIASAAANKHHYLLNHRPTLLDHCHRENKSLDGRSSAIVSINKGSVLLSRPKLRRSPRMHSSSLASESIAQNRKQQEMALESTNKLCRKAHAPVDKQESVVPKKSKHTTGSAVEQLLRYRRREVERSCRTTERLKPCILPPLTLLRRSPRKHPSSMENDCNGARILVEKNIRHASSNKPDTFWTFSASSTKRRGKRSLNKMNPGTRSAARTKRVRRTS